MFKPFEDDNMQSFFFSSVESFWTILNNQHVIYTTKNLNGRSKATPITCYNFSTPFTKISHGKLIGILNEHIDFCFNSVDGEFVVVDKYGTQLSNM